MRILIDTNVILSREDNHKLKIQTANLFKIAPLTGYEIVYHIKQLDDIKKDKNENRKEITLSKLRNYQKIEFCQDPNEDLEFIKIVGIPKKDNDDIDNNLLYALKRDAVEFLITEDVEIHKKAEKINLEQRVFTIDEASFFFEDLQTKRIKSPFFLEEIEWAELDINDSFFDSLKKDYSEFEKWYSEKAREGRKGWIYKPKCLEAICLWKIEKKEFIPELLNDNKNDRIKICTMKVDKRGFKIGELFMQLIFELARQNNIFEIYVSAFPDKKSLIYLLQQFGFQKKGQNDRGENFYLKLLKPPLIFGEENKELSNLDFSKMYYPSLLTKNCDIYTIPIQAKYFKVLFNQFDKSQSRLIHHITRTQIPGNSIKKAYLNKRITRLLKPGDLITFYRSQNKSAIVSIGIIEEVFTKIRDLKEVKSKTGKRTVYDDKEIKDMINNSKNGITIILFRHHFYFDNEITIKYAIESGILNGVPQSLTRIKNKSIMLKIIKERIHDSNNFIY